MAAFCALALAGPLIGIIPQPVSAGASTVTADEDTNMGGGGIPEDLTAAGDKLSFMARAEVASSDECRNELWKSDGTEDGTVMVKDVQPISDCHAGEWFTDVNGTLFFTAIDGSQLWKSDGTEAGTAMVKDINPGGHSLNVGGTLFFTAIDGTHGEELWKSDGTEDGTVIVKDIDPEGSADPTALTDVDGTLFFLAKDPLHPQSSGSPGSQLWKSDGTEDGTVMVKDLNPDPGTAFAGELTDVSGTLFFSASDATGRQLWKSDGTQDGTVVVKDLNAARLTNVAGTLSFVVDNELWKSDGTENGTVMVKNIDPSGSPVLLDLIEVGGTLFFFAQRPASSGDSDMFGVQLWKSDGTEEGTVRLKDIDTDQEHFVSIRRTAVAGTLFFSASDATGGQLWKSDGTEDGTVVLKDFNATWLTNVASTLFFVVDNRELWKSDGTEEGTVMVKDINPTPSAEKRGRSIGLRRWPLRNRGIAKGFVRLEEPGRPAAVRGVPVRIQRAPLGTADWRTIRKPRTDMRGLYRTRRRILRTNGQPRPGRYRAVAPRFTFTALDGTEVTALRAVSPIRRVPRR